LLVNEKTITALNRKESSQDEEVIFPGINTLTLFQDFPFDARKSLQELFEVKCTQRRVLAPARGLRETLRQRKVLKRLSFNIGSILLYWSRFSSRIISPRSQVCSFQN
jgi:hypothetical protein